MRLLSNGIGVYLSAFSLLGSAWASSSFAREGHLAAKHTTVKELNPREVAEGLLAHAGNLWVGSNKANGFELFVYDAKTDLLKISFGLPHSVEKIVPYGSGVIAVGKVYIEAKYFWQNSGWQSWYSIVDLSKKRSVSSYGLEFQYQVDTALAVGEDLYLADLGSRSIIIAKIGSSGIRHIINEISAAGRFVATPDKVFVVERNGFSLNDENIIAIDRKTYQSQRLFSLNNKRLGVLDLVYMSETNEVVANEINANQLILVNNNTLQAQAFDGDHLVKRPLALTRFNSCLVSYSRDEESLQFFKFQAGVAPKLVAQVDLANIIQELPTLRFMAVDSSTGNIYMKSLMNPLGYKPNQAQVVKIAALDSNENSVNLAASCSP